MTDLFNPPTLEEIEKLHGPVPVPGRALTPEEQARVMHKPPRLQHSVKGERWARERLVTLMGAELEKNRDELKSYIDQDGDEQKYRTGGKLDYSGKIVLQWNGDIRPVPIEMEVKTFEDAFPLGNLREKQYKLLDRARARALTLVCLVEHQRGTIVRGWYIPWRAPGDSLRGRLVEQLGILDYADLVEALRARSQGNYKGRSFRHQDQDLLMDHVVEKAGRRWQLCWWLRQLRPGTDSQPHLF